MRRAIFGFLALVALAGCAESEISLEDLYKRAEAAENPPKPKVVDPEDAQWSTENLLGWNSDSANDGAGLFDALQKRHAHDEEEAFGHEHSTKKTHETPAVHNAANNHKAHKVAKKVAHHAKVKALKVKQALVTKGIEKGRKSQQRAQEIPARVPSIPQVGDSIVPESDEHPTMFATHVFESQQSQPSKPKKTKKMPAFPGILDAPMETPADPAGGSLTNMASDLLNAVDKKQEKASRIKVKKAKKAKESAQKAKKRAADEKTADPFQMDLSDDVGGEDVKHEDKLPPLGSFLGGDDGDDDDDF